MSATQIDQLSRQAACLDLADELIGAFGQALARTLDVEHRGGSLAIHQLGDARAMSGAAQARLQLLGFRDEARRICRRPRENDWRLHLEDACEMECPDRVADGDDLPRVATEQIDVLVDP